jgi:hypothetical protein
MLHSSIQRAIGAQIFGSVRAVGDCCSGSADMVAGANIFHIPMCPESSPKMMNEGSDSDMTKPSTLQGKVLC